MLEPDRTTRCRLIVALALGLLAWAGLGSAKVVAAQPGAPRAYPLRYARAAEVQPVLSQLLAGQAGGVELSIDTARNQLLLSGPSEAHRLARELVTAMDKPSVRASGGGQPVLRAYAYKGSGLAEAASRLEALLPADSGAQVTADERSGQLLVWGPPAAQAIVPQSIEMMNSVAPADQAGAGAGGARRVKVVRLAQTQVGQIEPMLRDMLAQRLTARPTSDTQSNTAAYTLAGVGGGAVEIVLDARQNQIVLDGPGMAVAQLERLIHALDGAPTTDGGVTRIVPLRNADLSKVRRAVGAVRGEALPQSPSENPNAPANEHPTGDEGNAADDQSASAQRGRGNVQRVGFKPRSASSPARLSRAMLRQPGQLDPPPTADAAAEPAPSIDFGQPLESSNPAEAEMQRERLRELGTDVEVEALQDLGVIILRGNQRDVDEVIRIIQEIERLSAEAEPIVDVFTLTHVGSEKLAATIKQVQLQLLAGRPGSVNVTPLVKPNALLIIGWGEALDAMKELIVKLDQPVEAETQLRIFPLAHAPASQAERTVEQFFAKRNVMGTKVLVVADARTNSLLVQADPRDLAEVEVLIRQLDSNHSAAANELRVFRLRNTLALDLGPVLQQAISPTPPQGAAAAAARSAMLKFLTIDAGGQRVLESNILSDVKVTPDPRTNTLLVSAPADTMNLLVALIEQLDSIPAAEAQIKVFTILNGDASSMVEMLRSLLEIPGSPQGPQLAGASDEDSMAPLRFAVDQRTNTIIASGSVGDLNIVEAVLLRLDDSDVRERRTTVYRLKNAPSGSVAQTVNDYLRNERLVQQSVPGSGSAFRRIETEVVVVPETVSNALVISASPRYYEEIVKLVEQLDAQPPQVMIQVLIVEVTLNRTNEWGVELGLQDSVLFNRSLVGNVVSNSATAVIPTAPITVGNVGSVPAQIYGGNGLLPGYNFNNQPLGNAYNAPQPNRVGSQGLSSFSVGRTNSDLGFGGLVFSASSENVSVLLRALKAFSRVQVLSRPQIMTLDNQPAYVRVGQRIPQITNASPTTFGLTTSVGYLDIGLILGVTPRISPDGLVVMEVDTEKSAIDPNINIPISAVNGVVITQPGFDATTAQTTVSAADGQTIVLGGLITNRNQNVQRGVPYLSDIPIIGNIFRYELRKFDRTELLIILTPHIVRNEADANAIKQAETDRISWCLADAERLHGDLGVSKPNEMIAGAESPVVVYPDVDPRGTGTVIPAEEVPEGQQVQPQLEFDERGPVTPPGPADATGPVLRPAPGPVPGQPAQPGQPMLPVLPSPSDGANHGAPNTQTTANFAPQAQPLRNATSGNGAPRPLAQPASALPATPGAAVRGGPAGTPPVPPVVPAAHYLNARPGMSAPSYPTSSGALPAAAIPASAAPGDGRPTAVRRAAPVQRAYR